MGQTQTIGAAGENAATQWLTDNGFEIVARNWRSGRYELDIVARRREGTLHFIEVKTRANGSWESPEDAMNAGKRRAFVLAAQAYLSANPTDLEPQFDLVAIDTSAEGITSIRYIPFAVLPRW